MGPGLHLTTARLRMQPIGLAHLSDLVALDSDPEVMRYINGGRPTTRDEYESGLLSRMMAYADEPFGYLAAYEADGFVGWFHLRPSVAEPEILELGYRLRRAAWGRGLATEGGRALVEHAFDELDTPAVDACADQANAASIGVMKKCGMRAAGTFMHPRAGFMVARYIVRRGDPRPWSRARG